MIFKPTVYTSQGALTMTRSDIAREFECARCPDYKRAKKAKNAAIWQVGDDTALICNGCYGEILQKDTGR